jgi:DNA replication licensing factor MCM7
MLDKKDQVEDKKIAEHVTYVHQNLKPPLLLNKDGDVDSYFSKEFLRWFISVSRKVKPYIPKEITPYISNLYVTMRKNDTRNTTEESYATPRTLLAILRLSQALV